MKKTHSVKWLGYGLIGVVMAVMSACSDGALPEAPKTPSISPPVINSFTASADTVNAGESIELAWSVGGADKVTLASESGSLAEHDVEAEGKETVANIQADEVYNLVAYNQGVASMATVRVSVAKKAEVKIIKFAADAAVIEPGQSTKLCFEVQPADATVKITDAANTEVPLAGEEAKPEDVDAAGSDEEPQPLAEGIAVSIASKSLNLLPPKVAEVAPEIPPADGSEQPVVAGGEEQPAPAASKIGCTVDVTPAETTTYKLVATAADGTTAEQTTEVTVEAKLDATLVAKDADGKEIASPIVSSTPVKATLEWVVIGSYDKIEIDQGVGDVSSATADGKGSKEVDIAATTTYTLKISKGENEPVTKQVTITIEAPAVSTVTLTASSNNVFSGEEVTFTVSTGGDIPSGASVALRSPGSGDVRPVDGGSLKLKVDSTSSYVADVKVGDKVQSSDPITVNVRSWDQVKDGVATAVGEAAGSVIAGFESMLGGSESITLQKKDGAKAPQAVDLSYVSSFKGAVGGDAKDWIASEFDRMGPYRVNAIAVNPKDPSQVVVGVPGAVFLSSDGGKSFTIVDAIRVLEKGKGTHASCKGRIQNGLGSSEIDNFAGVQNVCDIIILPSGRTVMAYDIGTVYTTNIAGRAKDKKNKEYFWKGVAQDGKGGNTLYGIVSHDLAYDSSKGLIYVATDKGVFQSGDEAATFTEIGAIGKAAYSVVIASNGDVYAGGADALYKLSSGKWEQAQSFGAGSAPKEGEASCPDGSSCVTAIVEDPSTPGTLYVSNGAGLHVLRNGKLSTTISTDIGGSADAAVTVGAVLAAKEDIYLGTSNGLYVSRGMKSIVDPFLGKPKDEPKDDVKKEDPKKDDVKKDEPKPEDVKK